MQVHALLKEHDLYLHYSLEDLEFDAETAWYARSKRTREVLQQAG